MHCLVEKLTLANWLGQIFPLALNRPIKTVWVVDAKPFVLKMAAKMGDWFGIQVETLQFRLVDIKDDQGLFVRLRMFSQDLPALQKAILSCYPLEQLRGLPGRQRLLSFVFKQMTEESWHLQSSLHRALLLIEVCRWKMKQVASDQHPSLLLLKRRPWFQLIQQYGKKYQAEVSALLPQVYVEVRRPWLRKLFLWFQWLRWRLTHRPVRASENFTGEENHLPKLGTEYYAQFNLNRPELYSDFFFWHASSFLAKDIVAFFNFVRDPLDQEKLTELNQAGIKTVVLHPKATRVSHPIPIKPRFRYPTGRPKLPSPLFRSLAKPERWWLKHTVEEYEHQKAYWLHIFSSQAVRVYLSWFRYEAAHCAITDALQELGGVMAIYQRALDTNPMIDSRIDTDVFFGFSHFVADIERKNESIIPYFIVTGYIGDHRFPLLKKPALEVRKKLMDHGAKKILAYTDENSAADSRWHTGHEFMRENYAFLLPKVLAHPWFGLILKPKIPSTLRRRLGPLAPLLDEAIATGRCYLFEGGRLHGHYPPAIAGLAADVVVHGHLAAGTAALECALAGVPTLLMDREGWGSSPLYDLGVGKVVFNDWNHLWEVCLEQWHGSQRVPGFGDWSGLLDQMDPFRDGRAAERIGTYLQWMIEDFKAGCKRATAMANAAQRYAEQWGQDKVLAINTHG